MIDSHAHLEMLEEPEKSIEEAFSNGIKAILTVVDPTENIKRPLELAEKYENIWFACGVHPHNAKEFDANIEEKLIELLSHPKCVALGEVGLDFHYNFSNPALQKVVFKSQLDIAARIGLPVIIHTRKAFQETLDILNAKFEHLSGVLFHCFSQGAKEAELILSKSGYISFAGNITYPKAEELRDAAQVVPLEKMLVETDCPFLTPQPVRGKKNKPLFIIHTYELLSRVKGSSIDTVAQKAAENFERFFNVKLKK